MAPERTPQLKVTSPVYRVLLPQERVEDRPFTDPEGSLDDVEFMTCMIERLRQFLIRMRGFGSSAEAPYRLNFRETGGRRHQLIITDPERLALGTSFVAVGFFGQRGQDAAAAAEVHQVDEELIEDFPRFGGLLSYSTLELGCGDWGNLATFRDWAGMESWRQNDRHTQAVKQLAHRHYASLRLHIAEISGSMRAERVVLRVVRSKYYAYQDEQVWMALREHEGALYGPWVVEDSSPPYRWARGA